MKVGETILAITATAILVLIAIMGFAAHWTLGLSVITMLLGLVLYALDI